MRWRFFILVFVKLGALVSCTEKVEKFILFYLLLVAEHVDYTRCVQQLLG